MIEQIFVPVVITPIGIILSVLFPILGLLFGVVALFQGNFETALVFLVIFLVSSVRASTE